MPDPSLRSQPFAQIDGSLLPLKRRNPYMLEKRKVNSLKRQGMFGNIHSQHLLAEIIQSDNFKSTFPSVYESLGSILLAKPISPGYNFDFPSFGKSTFDAFEKATRKFCFSSISTGKDNCRRIVCINQA
jgi:hypothetical protein